MIRTIRLPNGRSVRLGVYVRAWKALRAQFHPRHSPMHDDSLVAGFYDVPDLASNVLRDIRKGVHDRINRHLPWHGIGRKWGADWQADAWRTSRDVNTPRLAVHWIPVEFRARLAHRISTED